MHVVDGDGAEQPASFVAHRHGEEVVAGEPLGDVPVAVVRFECGVVGEESAEFHARRFAQQSLDVGDTEILPRRGPERRLAHEDLRGDADHPVGIADLGECLRHGRGGPEDDDLGRHQATGGALFVFEQAADHVGVVFVHHAEHALLIRRRHLSDEVGEVVVLHLVEHADQPVEIEFRHDADLLFLRQLLEHVGEALVVHRLGELPALVDGQRTHDGGDLRRVEVAAAVRPRPASRWARRTGPGPRRSRPGDSSGGDAGSSCATSRTRSITQNVERLPVCSRRAMSLTVSSPILRSIKCWPISTSPGRGLNGLRSTSQLRRRAPSLSSVAIRLALTKMLRR